MSPRLLTLFLAALMVPGLGVARGFADQGAALVTRLQGTVTPPLAAYAEIPPDTTIALGDGASLTLLHYESCKQVVVTGGRITVGKSDLGLGQARVAQETPNKCPPTLRIKPAGEAAGVRLRGAAQPVPLPARLDCVLVGPQAGDYAAATVLENDQPRLSLPVVDQQLRWPAGQALLTVGAVYDLRLEPKAQAPAAILPFRVQDASPGDEACLIRVKPSVR